jgi:NADH:ubiquinone oxidoreductase subunit E
MSKSHDAEVFYLEGDFVNFVIKDGYKLKGLLLNTREGEIYIKLAKHLRHAVDWRLTKGARLQIVGEKIYDWKKGVIKFKADRILSASEGLLHQEIKEIKQIKEVTRETQSRELPTLTLSKSASPRQERVKKEAILVCQKSDCMKRGGQKLCQALEAAISDRGLENEVMIKGTGCMKNCKAGPNLIMPDKTRYSRIQGTQVSMLMDKHFGKPEELEPLVEVVDSPVIPIAS